MGIGRLFGSQHFRVLSNLTRLSIIPSLLAIACSEFFKYPLVPKTGPTIYLLTGAMTVLVGLQIIAILDSRRDGFSPYETSFVLRSLLSAAEKSIVGFCRMMQYLAYLMVFLGGIATPIFAILAKEDEFQEMPVVLIPDSMINLTFSNVIAVIVITAITSGHRVPIYRSFNALKKFDEFIKKETKLALMRHEPVFIDWVPTLTFYVLRIFRNLGAIVFNLVVRLNELIPIKKFLIIFRPIIWLADFAGFIATSGLWLIHQLMILTVRWSATLVSSALFTYFLYLNSNNFLSHIGHLNWTVAARFGGMFLATFYTFATAYLFHLDMKFFADTERKVVTI